MTDPYSILGVSPDAGDEEVHRAYLEGVRRCPPDNDPNRFQALNKAYETLKTRKRRLQYALFDTEPPDTRTLFERACPSTTSGRASLGLVAAVLRATAATGGQGGA